MHEFDKYWHRGYIKNPNIGPGQFNIMKYYMARTLMTNIMKKHGELKRVFDENRYRSEYLIQFLCRIFNKQYTTGIVWFKRYWVMLRARADVPFAQLPREIIAYIARQAS